MVDTVRTLAALQTLLADNVAGDIGAQDLRDMMVSLYGIDFKPTTDDPPDDEFDDTAGMSGVVNGLDAKWTAVTGASGVVDLLETADVSKYDLASRSGSLLMQVGSSGAEEVALRQDFTLPDGASILAAIAPTVGIDAGTGVIAQERIRLTVNNDNTGPRSGTFLDFGYEAIGTDVTGLVTWDGASALTTAVAGAGVGEMGLLYLRIARSGTTYLPMYSLSGGAAWTPMGVGYAIGSVMDNIWIGYESFAAHGALTPIAAFDWVRQGTNAVDPW